MLNTVLQAPNYRATLDPATTTSPLDLEVIVPALNEEQRIEPTLFALVEELRSLPMRSRVRVIDNGSSDLTPDAVDRVGRSLGTDVVALSGCSIRGKGSAVTRGMLSSSARYMGFCDADLATPATAIREAVDLLDEGWSVVVGSRTCAGAVYVAKQSVTRRAGAFVFRRVASAISGGIGDTQCGFKFFTQEAAQRIFSHTIITGFAFDVEVIARAKALGLGVKEMPVHWSDKPGSTFDPLRDGLAAFADLLELWRAVRARGVARV